MPVYRLYQTTSGIVHRDPPKLSTSWAESSNAFTKYIAALEAVDLQDPTEGSAHYARALDLRKQSRIPVAIEARAAVERSIAVGDVSPEDGVGLLATAGSSSAHAVHDRRLRQRSFTLAANGEYLAALRSVYDFGEEAWLDLLRPMVAKLLDKPPARAAEEYWKGTFDLAGVVRSLGGVSSYGHATRVEYSFGYPDVVQFWLFDQSATVGAGSFNVGPNTIFSYERFSEVGGHKTHRFATRAEATEHRDEWLPDIYTAGEVEEHILAIARRQQEMVDAARPETRARVSN